MTTGTVKLDGKSVQELRLARGWSQQRACDELEALARKENRLDLQVSLRTWQRAEQGLPIQAASARSIAAALSASVDVTSVSGLLRELVVWPDLEVAPPPQFETDVVSPVDRTPSIVEYLYVDEPRLAAYVDQIGPPVTYERVPTWNTTTKACTQKRMPRDNVRVQHLTQHQKITTLLQHLMDNDLLSIARPVPSANDMQTKMHSRYVFTPKDFAYEVCTATKVIVPAKPGTESDTRRLTLWISVPSAQEADVDDVVQIPALELTLRAGMLCLIEDWSDDARWRPWSHDLREAIREAAQPTDTRRWYNCSTYSLLKRLLFTLPWSHNILRGFEGFDAYVPAMDGTLVSPFVADPVGTLNDLGCTAVTSREVRVLYRVREVCPYVKAKHTCLIGVIAYPVFIAATQVHQDIPV